MLYMHSMFTFIKLVLRVICCESLLGWAGWWLRGWVKNSEFYEQVLGLQWPWKVEQVELDRAAQRVVVHVVVEPGTKWGDPATQGPAHVHQWRQRRWRHLDTCQFETVISARVPSVKYADGRVEEVAVPWAERYQRVTRLMAQAVVVWLQACGSVSQVAKVMRLNWHTVNAIMKSSVDRGLERREREPIAYLGLDEPQRSGDSLPKAALKSEAKPRQKSFRRGHVYATMLNDLDGGRVWDLVEGRKEEQARKLLQKLDARQRAGVKAVAMDIRSAYRNAVEKLLPQADIVHDKFHLCAYLNKAVDMVRKAEHRELASSGRQTLKGSKYLWLRNFPDLRLQPSFRQLYHLNLRTSRAWWLKETFGAFLQYCYEGAARKFFADWLAQVTRSALTPMKKVAEMLFRHLPGLLNYLKHRITNAASEGINSQVARTIANARGLACFENLRG